MVVRGGQMLDQLPEPTQFDVVFVTGLHKSGTSALVQVLADRFLDTSRITNPTERGFGRSSPRYLTRECKTVRAINERYRSNALAMVGWTVPIALSTPSPCELEWVTSTMRIRAP